MKKTILLSLLASAMGAAHAGVLLEEGFDNIDNLSPQGWVFSNGSVPPGAVSGWYQGFQEAFPAQSGAANAYAASNFNAAQPGGVLDNWLLTPEFSLATTVTVTFWLRSELAPGFSDQVRFGFTEGGATLDDYLLATSVTAPTGGWTQYTLTLGSQGSGATGRFAFQHFGEADSANYVGLDTLTITAVPEPSSAMILGLGLAGFAAARRRRA